MIDYVEVAEVDGAPTLLRSPQANKKRYCLLKVKTKFNFLDKIKKY